MIHGWRRFLPVAVAVGVSGVMMVMQVALAMGAFQMAAAPVRMSAGDLWVGPADARALDHSTGLGPFAASGLWLDPDIARIEPWAQAAYAQIGDDAMAAQASVQPIDAGAGAMGLARVVPPDLRARLAEPGTALIGAADAAKLGVSVGDTLRVSRQPLRIVGVVPELRTLFGTQLVTSDATARALSGEATGTPAFYILRLRDGADPAEVAERLMQGNPAPEYVVWPPDDLASATVQVWALESGAGTLFIASSAIALVITLMVVSQTLGAAVAGQVREYAALRAYGIGFGSLQMIVMRQGFYVSIGALGLTAALSAALLAVLRARNIATDLPLTLAAVVAGLLAGVVLVSNLFAVRRLRRADPAALLR
ncbi:ABC transporter permease [Paracoccus sp. (in: a-proteobacteria)]|uniref:ABC transporter permease n=1 Tax=Paracoccus sp. TaxID=267 RepID=UPI0026E08509|nr:ABC transporter permease [Paracoccus sp. (in: a-proteobacteria)]MDO5647246.1 ABC transporter permease [Paracoccus sp. (in: a-proteobacteria)]